MLTVLPSDVNMENLDGKLTYLPEEYMESLTYLNTCMLSRNLNG